MAATTSTRQPNTTLYLNNLNDKVNKDELRGQIYALFTTYGRIIDIVVSKAPRLRGQAFLVFADLASATTALRACQGMVIYDKPMRIDYAKTKSYATSKREDPNFVPPTAVHASDFVNGKDGKRARDEDTLETRNAKREKADDSDEEMEIDDEDEQPVQNAPLPTITSAAVPAVVHQVSAKLLCTNLPQEVTEAVLSVLFQQYRGLLSTQVVQSPNPGPDGTKAKMAQVLYETPELGSVAKEALNGFQLKKGWNMAVAYI
ncbi:hypothetical protein BD626DRAFT_480655 [Schizophyllum amplum]|uniref:RRM domain-containing protein n=1 Tax=Schizophyllum amplum TaxID=97359 RepID=A0A550CTE9_9AGAR|nr:hypothetical protein BD626DRAFT_480655 [Auriculariopsis ampla]